MSGNENESSSYSIDDEYEHSENDNISDVDVEPSSLLPPPLWSYPTFESLQSATREWTKSQGYDLVIRNTYRHNSKIVRRYLECGRARVTKNSRKLLPEDRQRKTSSHKQNCEMGIWYVADNRENPNGSWSIKYKNGENFLRHNHGPEVNIANHRRYDRDENLVAELQSHAQTGISTAQSMAILRQKFPHAAQKTKDICNMKSRFRREMLNSMTATEALLLRLQQNCFFASHTTDSNNHLNQLFFAHPKSIKLLKQFNDILLLDCTYKTNRYGKPLLNFCGVTGSNKTIQLALCFMENEKCDAYTWALTQFDMLLKQENIKLPELVVTDRDRALLNALKIVFPKVNGRICMWHMNKDVHAYIRTKLGVISDPMSRQAEDSVLSTEFWNLYKKTIEAFSEEEFKSGCKLLEEKWGEGWNYLWNTWLKDFSEKCARYETNKILHFGVMSTSRVEGNHSNIKNWLQNSRSDLYGVIHKLIPWWENLYLSLTQHLEEEKRQILTSLQIPIFEKVNLQIFHYPLGLLEEQVKLARKQVKEISACQKNGQKVDLEVCKDVVGATLGLPCSHKIRDLLLRNESLSTSDFHPHWHIYNEALDAIDRPAPILEPVSAPPRNRRIMTKKKGTGKYGNRREMLHAEGIVKSSSFRRKRRN